MHVHAYMHSQVLTRPHVRLRLGLLPSRDASVPRTANIIKPAGHQIWQLATGKALQDYLAACFPQVGGLTELIYAHACVRTRACV